MLEGERRLAAIMFTDMVGYSSLTESDEALAIQVLERHNRILRPLLTRFHGKEVKTIGDAFLVEFESALDAVRCGIQIQSQLHKYNASTDEKWRIRIRVGIHQGDVIHKGGDVFGGAVNIASRIEPIARPEGICVSGQVYAQIRSRISEPCLRLDVGELKNLRNPVSVYEVVMPWQEQEGGARSPGEIKSSYTRIAVLPFVSLSPDPKDEYFADGLTEELIGRLSRVNGLEVIARTSVMSFKKREQRISEIARSLRVGTVMEGSVRKAGNRIRVAVQLISANSESHLWSTSYEEDIGDIFEMQTKIASMVVESFPSTLVRIRTTTAETREDTGDIAAYMSFLRGREMLREGSEASLRQAIGHLEKAVELDPTFARAYAALAACHQRMGNMGYEPYDSSLAKAKKPLLKALDLDPTLADAHAALSWMMYNEDDNAGAEAEARRSIELNPSLPEGYDALSNVLALRGDAEESMRLCETCYRLDPFRSRYAVQLGRAYFYSGREGQALEHWKKTAKLFPAGTYRLMTEYYLCKNDHARAREFYLAAERSEPNSSWVIWMKGVMAARSGDRAGALLVVREIEASGMGPMGLNYIAFIHHALGDFDSYFSYLNQAIERHALMAIYPMYSPLLEEGRRDPRCRILLDRAGSGA